MIDLAGKRAHADRVFRVLTAVAAALVLLVLGLIAITMTGIARRVIVIAMRPRIRSTRAAATAVNTRKTRSA